MRAYYYTAQLSPTVNKITYQEQERFFSKLDNVPYLTLRLGYLQGHTIKDKSGQIINTFREKGVDTRLVIDMVEMAYKNQFDTAILVSRDNDFEMLISIVQSLGKHVEVAFTSIAYHLHRTADISILLTPKFLQDCY